MNTSVPGQPSSPEVSARPLAAPQVSAYELDDDLVLYDTRTTQAHILNLSAAKIWALCDGSRSVSELADELVTTYALDRSLVQTDVRELVGSLHAAGLLTLV